jgi:lariat debranching enzyme
MEKNNKNTINIAITGCIHGHLSQLYTDLLEYQNKNNLNIDLVLCTGDFECMIKEDDLNYLNCPPKYKHMGDFHKYYEGILPIPFLTIFIGGNHEASNILNDFFYGGYITEKIYYLGRCGIINYKGIIIGGISGIYNKYDYLKGHYENNINSKTKSIFHQREFELAKISNFSKKIDIFMSHDWPYNIINKNDIKKICEIKPYWDDIENIGSIPNKFLLDLLKPKNWICGHMHFYYKNIMKFDNNEQTTIYCLDKCLKNRKYFEIITLNIQNNDDNIYIDNEWISISQIFNEIFPKYNSNYNFSDYINNSEIYLKYIIDTFPNYLKNEIKFGIQKQEFYGKLKQYKEKNKENKKIERKVNQKEIINKIFNLYNNLFSINKKENKNIEEINIDFI